LAECSLAEPLFAQTVFGQNVFWQNHCFALTGFWQHGFRQNVCWQNHFLQELDSGRMDLGRMYFGRMDLNPDLFDQLSLMAEIARSMSLDQKQCFQRTTAQWLIEGVIWIDQYPGTLASSFGGSSGNPAS
jgi:hypothetical protein